MTATTPPAGVCRRATELEIEMNARTSEFIGYSCGLECFVAGKIRMIKVEYNRTQNGRVSLSAVSGNTLGSLKSIRPVTISHDDFEDRPRDKSAEAMWALNMLELIPAKFDAGGRDAVLDALERHS